MALVRMPYGTWCGQIVSRQRWIAEKPAMTFPLDYDRLGFQADAEALVHAGLDGSRQRDHLAAGGAAAIDQHQGLLLVDARVADRLALPAAGVDQPAGRQLHAAVGHGVMNDVRL